MGSVILVYLYVCYIILRVLLTAWVLYDSKSLVGVAWAVGVFFFPVLIFVYVLFEKKQPTVTRACSACRANLSPTASFCGYCGMPVPPAVAPIPTPAKKSGVGLLAKGMAIYISMCLVGLIMLAIGYSSAPSGCYLPYEGETYMVTTRDDYEGYTEYCIKMDNLNYFVDHYMFPQDYYSPAHSTFRTVDIEIVVLGGYLEANLLEVNSHHNYTESTVASYSINPYTRSNTIAEDFVVSMHPYTYKYYYMSLNPSNATGYILIRFYDTEVEIVREPDVEEETSSVFVAPPFRSILTQKPSTQHVIAIENLNTKEIINIDLKALEGKDATPTKTVEIFVLIDENPLFLTLMTSDGTTIIETVATGVWQYSFEVDTDEDSELILVLSGKSTNASIIVRVFDTIK